MMGNVPSVAQSSCVQMTATGQGQNMQPPLNIVPSPFLMNQLALQENKLKTILDVLPKDFLQVLT